MPVLPTEPIGGVPRPKSLADQADEGIRAARPLRPRQGNGEHILVVDDEPALVRVLTRLLTLLGYVARGTTIPEDALAMLADGRCDLALADFSMPRMNGVDLARRLHEIRPDLPILMMSGYSAPVDAAVLAGVGVYEVLEKPISQVALAEKIRLAIERSRAPR